MRRPLLGGALLLALAALAVFWSFAREEPREVALDAARTAEAERAPPAATIVPSAGDSERAATEAAPVAAPAAVRPIELIVCDEHARPIAGASVVHFANPAPRKYATDADGRCRIELAEGESTVQLSVAAAGYLHARNSWPRRPEMRVQLRRLIALSGRVLDRETRAPIASARVAWMPDCCRACQPTVVLADDSGGYRLDALPFDRATLQVEAEGYSPIHRQYELGAAGDAAVLELTLARGTTLRGRVVDFTTGAGLAGASVNTGGSKLAADASGAFEGQVVAPVQGALELYVDVPDRCQLRFPVTAEDLARGEELVIRLPESPVVEGTVFDPDGRPLSGVRVNVWHDDVAEIRAREAPQPEPASPLSELPRAWRFSHGDSSASSTDAAGAFRSTGLLPWSAHCVLIAFPKGFETLRIPLERLPGPGEHVRIDVHSSRAQQKAGGYVYGRIYLNGLPVPGAVSWRAGSASGETEATLGGYQSGELAPGPVELRARVAACPGALEGDVAQVEIVAGQSLDRPFELRTASTTVRGNVRFQGGGPAAGATVNLFVAGGPSKQFDWLSTQRQVIADAAGAFSFDVPACQLELRIAAQLGGAHVARDGVRPGADGVELLIASSGTLLFRVVDAKTGERLEPRSLMLYALEPGGELIDDLNRELRVPDAAGWSSRSVRAGPIELMACGGGLGYRSQRASASIAANSETRVELSLSPGLRAEFRLDPPPDEGWKRYAVYVVEPASWAAIRNYKDELGNHFDTGPAFPHYSLYERRLQFDEHGVARLSCLGPGPYRFRILPEGITLDPESIELSGDTTEPIVVRWKR